MKPSLSKALALAAALVTTSYAGAGLQVTALGLGSALLMAGEAMAVNAIPGVGLVVKKKPGNAPVAKGESDDKGEMVFMLEPGRYSITVGDNKPQNFAVKPGQKGIKVVVTGTKEDYVGQITPLR